MAHSTYATEVGNWLDSLAPWTFWCTFTFRYSPSLPSVRRSMEKFNVDVSPTLFFWGSESGACTGRNHVHALLYFDSQRLHSPLFGELPISSRAIWQKAFNRFGRSHVDEFEAEKGASHYVSKYVSKQISDWDILHGI